MKKNMKKALSVMLIGIMAVSMIACSSKSSTTEEEKKPATSTSEKKETEAKSNTEETKKTEEAKKTLADYSKVDAFNYYNIAAGVSDEELNASESAKLVEAETGYKVTYTQAPADATDAQTAVQSIFLLKQDYQAVRISKNQFYTLLAMDALHPITEYVDASTNLKEQISAESWDTAKKDGEIYGIPQINPIVTNSVGICYRADWLQEYNAQNPNDTIPMPSAENAFSMKLSDFKKMLMYFKTKVPEGGYAMAIDTNCIYLENILPAFGIYQDWADVDGKLVSVIDQPGFKDYVAYMEDLYDNDLIVYQATSEDAGAVKSLQARNVGAGRVAHWNAYAIETTNAPEGTDLSQYTDDTIGYIEALIPDDMEANPNNVKVFFPTSSGAYYTVVPKFATPEQAAAVVDFADKKLEKDLFLKLVLGTEGETFKIENGSYYPILPTFNEKQGLADKFLDGLREKEYTTLWLCRTRKTASQDKMFSSINSNLEFIGSQSPLSVMPPNETYDTYNAAAGAEVRNVIVLGMYQKGVDLDIEAVKAKWLEFEGKQIEDSVNEWYQSWLANK